MKRWHRQYSEMRVMIALQCVSFVFTHRVIW